MQVMRKILTAVVAIAISFVSYADTNYRAADLAGVWFVVENSKKTDEMQKMELRLDGSAAIKYPNIVFNKKWKVSDRTLTVYAADDGAAPGPPDRYSIIELDTSKKSLRIRHEELRRDIKLQKK